MALAVALREGLLRLEPTVDIFLHPIAIISGFWLPKLAEGIGQADAFLLMIGPSGIGPWQAIEYYTAFDRSVYAKRFPLVPVLVAGGEAPGLPFLRNLNRVEAPVVADDTM